MPGGNQAPKPRDYKWIDIDDFTPGIFQYSPDTNSAAPPGSHPAPHGACTDVTYGCLPIPSGGLAPGPGFIAHVPYDEGTIASEFGTNSYYLSSFQVNTMLDTEVVEFVLVLEGIRSDDAGWLQICVSQYSGGMHVLTNGSLYYAGETVGITATGTCAFVTRLNPANLGPTFVTQLVAPYGGTFSNTQPVLAYPDPANATLLQVNNMNPGIGNISALCVGYQGRVVVFQTEAHPWPPNTSTIHYQDNDALYWTDPSGAYVLGSQEEYFVPEDPTGYGAAGSISAGELFLVKNQGGGCVVTGDLNNPQITYLPGVQPINGFPGTNLAAEIVPVGSGCSSSQGFYYCSSNAGVWRWNGGNSSQKVSPQLSDNAWFNPNFAFASMIFNCVKWGQYILVSNNWIYDEILGSWWRLSQNPSVTTPPYFWYGIDGTSDNIFAAPTSIFSGGPWPGYESLADQYSRTYPSNTYVWQSQPIRLAEDSQADIREISIRAVTASGQQADCSIAITLTNESGVTQSFPAINNMSGGDNPTTYRSVGGFKATNLQITLTATNTTGTTNTYSPAPTIYSVSVGFKSREKTTTI